MKEILAKNIENIVDVSKRAYCGDRYEVWQVSDGTFNILCNMSDETFYRQCPNGWWRSADGSNMGVPNYEFTINGHLIDAWMRDAEDEEEKEYYDTPYSSLTEYLRTVLGASTERNVCALAVDLAKYNNMTMAQLFQKYEPIN